MSDSSSYDSQVCGGRNIDRVSKLKNSKLFFENEISNGLISTKKAAKFLDITPNALRIKVYRGQVKCSKLNGRLKFRIADLLLALKTKGA